MLSSPSTGLSNIPPPSTAAATGPTIATSTTTSAPPVPGPGPAATGASLKRPAAADLQRSAGTSATPSKRQATSGSRTNPIPNPSPLASAATNPITAVTTAAAAAASGSAAGLSLSSASAPPTATAPHTYLQPQAVMSLPPVVTEEQLLGRTPEQLIATILQIQMQHQQYVAHISAQFDTISQQLNDLRGSLVASHQAAASALSSRDTSSVRPIVPPPPQPQQPVATFSRGPPIPMQTPSRPARPPASPSTSQPQPRPSVQTPLSGPPQYKYGTVGTVEDVWKEYREGMDGQPAVEELDATWGSRWRPEPRGRTWYSRRKVIWDKIKEYMAEGLDEEDAVREVEKLRDGNTINKLIRMLQDERKEKGIGDDSMAG
ncbi:transcriptional activator of glycolytic enzymes-domain-containing protein [Hypoxylon trugodes]|uniref:transcriptional activator of glycolytic enzymes-domain-containing protein n=1 Tax=Hypoxylon trugodes TaxID=326681 RepID=UPI00219443FA|nr:transcriptional activator of glycolytic enzymes-domain-containing protein [Hypoxylon trugodes]KAI1388078.1 transcriptional activator of glycolytic enzymes-domain-containing protein [Hypoxylon trugodes]